MSSRSFRSEKYVAQFLKELVLAGATQTVITVAFLPEFYQKFIDEVNNFTLRGK
jgi:hypothetical protein